MTKHDGRGRPPPQADIGKLVMLRSDRGVRYSGIFKTLTRGGTALMLCFGTDCGGDWKTYRKPEHVIVTGAEVLDDG